jgi:hypothetical protein
MLRFAQFAGCFALLYCLAVLIAANVSFAARVLTRTNLAIPLVGGVETPTLRALDSTAPPLDVLFVGSSHAQLAFDPRFFDRYGLRTFTLASPLQTPKSSYYLLHHYAPRVKPKVLVFECWWEVFASDGVEASTRLALAMPASADLWRMVLATPSPKVWNAALLRIADFSGRLPQRRNTNPNFATYQDRGFFAIPPGRAGNRQYPRQAIQLRAEQLSYLRRIIRLVRAQGTRVLLVVAPVPEATIRNIENFAQVDSTMRTLAAQEGVRYVDFSPLVQLDPIAHVHDAGHLTEAGARLFMETFMHELGSEIEER